MTEQKIADISIASFKEKVAKGVITALRLGDDFILSVKNFSPETGEEVKPARAMAVTLAQLESMSVANVESFAKQKEAHEKALVDIADIIAHLNSLE